MIFTNIKDFPTDLFLKDWEDLPMFVFSKIIFKKLFGFKKQFSLKYSSIKLQRKPCKIKKHIFCSIFLIIINLLILTSKDFKNFNIICYEHDKRVS